MSYPYQIARRGRHCVVYRNGHRLAVGGEGTDAGEAMTGLLAEHFRLGDLDLAALRNGDQGGPSVCRVRRLAAELTEVFGAGHHSFELTPQELDEILALQALCWMPGDHAWIPVEKSPGWIQGHVEEVRYQKTGTLVFVQAASDCGLTVSGRCAPGELAHRSKGGGAPWKR